MKFQGRTKSCENCKKSPRIQGERFCYKCKHQKLRDMVRDGYLEPARSLTERRLDSKR